MAEWRPEDRDYLKGSLVRTGALQLAIVLLILFVLFAVRMKFDPWLIGVVAGIGAVVLVVALPVHLVDQYRRWKEYSESKSGEERKAVRIGAIVGLAVALPVVLLLKVVKTGFLPAFLVVLPLAFVTGWVLKRRVK
jgi:hypothetical protein